MSKFKVGDKVRVKKDLDMSKFHQKIYNLRQKKGMTQEELAEKVGLSRGAIISIEKGERKVSVEELLKFSSVFDCTYSSLLSSSQNDNEIKGENGDKKNIRDLYTIYKEKYQQMSPPPPKEPGALDDNLREANPHYYPSTNNEVRYEK